MEVFTIHGKKRRAREADYPVNKLIEDGYIETRDWISNRYNMSNRDADILMEAINDMGACSYADTGNHIVKLLSAPEMQKKFRDGAGFPLFKQTKKGKWTINDRELLIDIYEFANEVDNGGEFIKTLSDGKKVIDRKFIEIDKNGFDIVKYDENDVSTRMWQKRMSSAYGIDEELVKNYLKSRNIDIEYEYVPLLSTESFKPKTDEQMKIIKKDISECMENGDVLNLIVNTYGEEEPWRFRMIDTENEEKSFVAEIVDSGHAMTITKMVDEGLYISNGFSGGSKKMFVPFEDLQKDGRFTIGTSYIPYEKGGNNIIEKNK